MAELTLTSFLTVDGVMQAPGGPEEDRDGGFAHGGWLVPHADEDMGQIVTESFAQADAFLLGRRTYDIFAAHWPHATEADDPVATALNRLPKHVATQRPSSSLAWGPAEAMVDPVASARALKQRYRREVQVHGSCALAQSLLAADLIDELRLLVFPVVLGSGKRLFGGGMVPRTLAHVRSRTTRAGAVFSVYRRGGALTTGSFMRDQS